LAADFTLQHAIDMRLILEDEAGRATARRDLGRDCFLGIRPAGRDLDGAESVLFDVLGVAAALARRKMLCVDAPAAAFIEDLGPALERIGERRADRLRMAHA